MNKANYRGREPKAHKEARLKIEAFLKDWSYDLRETGPIHFESEFGPKDYTPDIWAYSYTGGMFLVEIDGESHADRTRQDAIRDFIFRRANIPTVRFSVEEVIGFKFKGKRMGELGTSGILQRISESLSRAGLT